MAKRRLSLLAAIQAILLASCVTTPPAVVRLADNVFTLVLPLRYDIDGTNESIVVPAGFVTDLASIPKALHWWEGKVDRSMAAAIVHDYLYWDQRCTKDEADAVLYLAMKEGGVWWFKRRAVYAGVRTPIGQKAFEKNAKLKASGEPRFFSIDYVQTLAAEPAMPEATLTTLQADAVRAQGTATDTSNPNLKRSCAAALKTFHGT
jgi:hypothetical protein